MAVPKIKKLLIANRGEIACKIIRCAKKMKIPTVAIYSDEDLNCLHTELADEAVNIPGSLVSETYMNSYAKRRKYQCTQIPEAFRKSNQLMKWFLKGIRNVFLGHL